ncbi:hypothetical protein CEXT_487331, partial [Caerostris extrusa]
NPRRSVDRSETELPWHKDVQSAKGDLSDGVDNSVMCCLCTVAFANEVVGVSAVTFQFPLYRS